MIRRVLLTGGARSGKSMLAERMLRDLPTTYVATAPDCPDDAEWQRRIAEHRARRPPHWITVASTDLPTEIAAAEPERPVLVDCLTLWLTTRMDTHDAWHDPRAAEQELNAEIELVAAAVRASAGGVVLVTNEVGSGIVPSSAGTRLFRDLLGRCNAAICAACDEAYLVVAGRVLPLEPWPS